PHRLAQGHEVSLLADDQARVLLGLLPLLVERRELRAHGLGRGRQVDAGGDAADQQQLHRLRELVAAVAQLLEGFAVTLRGLLRRFREALREHPDLSHRRHVEGGEGPWRVSYATTAASITRNATSAV